MVSGFYKMLSVTMVMCRKMDYFKVSQDTTRSTVDHVIFRKLKMLIRMPWKLMLLRLLATQKSNSVLAYLVNL